MVKKDNRLNNPATKADIKELDKKIDISVEKLDRKIDSSVKRLDKKIDAVERSLEKKITLAISEYAENAKEERKKYYERIIDHLEKFSKEVKESQEDRVLLGHRVSKHDEKIEEHEERIARLEEQMPVSL